MTSGQSDAGDIARELAARARVVLQVAGHAECPMLDKAKYVPESGAVVCGCGEFEPYGDDDNPPWSEAPDSPPWAEGERSDRQETAERAVSTHRAGTLPYDAADPIASALALIDPAEMYTPADVERHILDVLYRLEVGALFERETVVNAWKTSQVFDQKFNACVATSEHTSADRRKAQAMVDCKAEYAAMCEAKMLKEAAKQTMHNLRSILSGYQSTARSVGSTYQAGGSQGAPPQGR